MSPLDGDELSGVSFQVFLCLKEASSGQESYRDVPSPPSHRVCPPVVAPTSLTVGVCQPNSSTAASRESEPQVFPLLSSLYLFLSEHMQRAIEIVHGLKKISVT